ncbi:MAG: hypothetical protein HQ558_05925 [Candidatus Omnitrophica bacterium]|nr:hypothetical protein [Candidatus Omnitrophota bacterium]
MDDKEKDIKELEKEIRRDFNNAMYVVGLSSAWVLGYLLIDKARVHATLTLEGALVICLAMSLLLIGLIVARRIVWGAIQRLFDYNQKMAKLQEELIEKSRLAAITETVLTLSHEINNPLMVIKGNVELLEGSFAKEDVAASLVDGLGKIKDHCEQIVMVTTKLASLSKPVEKKAFGDKKIIDVDKSE